MLALPSSVDHGQEPSCVRALRPLCIDLYCGLGGWAEGFLSEGWDVIGFDIERHDYGTGRYPGQLVLQDARLLHGAQFRHASAIVASPPCQEPSYRAMPWKRAKALPPPYAFMELFWTCFRIQHEAEEAAGHLIPLIVENVRGAEKWVGPARWHFGSYYLWGDVPALMPLTVKAAKVPGFRFDGSGKSFQTASVEGVKSAQDGLGGYGGSFGWNNTPMRRGNSKSDSRKAASAQIAKIPFPLAQWIARCYTGARP